MTNWVLDIGSIGIYVGALLTFLTAYVNPELKDIKTRIETFQRDYENKLKRLKSEAETDLFATISQMEKLKELFDTSTEEDDIHAFSTAERVQMSAEINLLTKKLGALAKPYDLYKSIKTQYNDVSKRLKQLTWYVVLLSFFIPIGIGLGISLTTPSITDDLTVYALATIYISLVIIFNPIRRYNRSRKSLQKTKDELEKLTDERLILSQEEVDRGLEIDVEEKKYTSGENGS